MNLFHTPSYAVFASTYIAAPSENTAFVFGMSFALKRREFDPLSGRGETLGSFGVVYPGSVQPEVWVFERDADPPILESRPKGE